MEMLVAGSLMALGLFILMTLLIRVSGVMNRVVVVSQLQQNCELTATRLTGFVARCDVGGVSFAQHPAIPGPALHPTQDLLPNH